MRLAITNWRTEMGKIIAKVFEESDYSKFVKLEGNRIVTQERFDKIIASIKKKEILDPIIVKVVGGKYAIINGQGRFEALKSLGRPIKFVVDQSADIDDCRRINSANTGWKPLDYIVSFASDGNPNYINMLMVIDKIGRTDASLIMRLCSHDRKADGRRPSDVINGTLSFTSDDANEVLNVISAGNDLADALAIHHPPASFYIATKIIMDSDGYSHKRMVDKCRKCMFSYVRPTKLSDNVKAFEYIYNYNVKTGKKIYFTDYLRNKGKDYSRLGQNNVKVDMTDVSTLKKSRRARRA